MKRIDGRCHCGNIVLKVEIEKALSDIHPRKCDCDFCTVNGLIFVSDPGGRLAVTAEYSENIQWIKQGSETAKFLSCKTCDDVLSALYWYNGNVYAAVNSRVLKEPTGFGEIVNTSPAKLSATEKADRWRRLWFGNVKLPLVPRLD